MTDDAPRPEAAKKVQDAVEKVGDTLAGILNGAIQVGLTEGLALQKSLAVIREARAWDSVQRQVIRDLAKRNSAFKTLLRDVLRQDI